MARMLQVLRWRACESSWWPVMKLGSGSRGSREKVGEHRDDLAAVMLTYPSTYGVYEDTISDVRWSMRRAAKFTLTARTSMPPSATRPGEFGADVSHLNLHKPSVSHTGWGPELTGGCARASRALPLHIR